MDEVLAGYATRIMVILHEDGSVEVEDDGRGMPVDLHPQLGLSGVEVIMTACMRVANSLIKTTVFLAVFMV